MKPSLPRQREYSAFPANRPWLLIVLVLLIYAPSWSNPFILDDFGHILKNPRLEIWENWPEIFISPYFNFEEAGLAQYYRPLTILTYKLEYLLFGKNPFGYHLVNTAFHCLNTLLVYLICRFLSGREIPAFGAALVFAVHPLQTEEVVYVSGLGGLGAAAGMLGSIYYFLKFRRERRAVFYLISLFSLAAALMYKESTLLLPLLIVWISVVSPAEKSAPKKVQNSWLYLAVYFLIVAAYLFVRSLFLVKSDFFSAFDAGFWARLVTFGKGLGIYVGLFLFPYGLHFYRSLPLLPSPWNAAALLFLGTALSVLLFIFLRKKRVPSLIAAGSGWFIISLLPFSGVNPIFLESGFLYWAEHFMYLPIIGLGMVISELVCRLRFSRPATRPRRYIFGFGLTVVLIYSLLTVRQNTFWSDETTFFERMVRFETNLFRTRGLLGVAYFKSGELEKALKADSEARRILLLRSGRSREAEMNPMDKYQLKVLLTRMARAYGNSGRLSECETTARELIELFPGYHGGYFILGRIMMESGQNEDALSRLEKAYEINPRNFEIAFSLIRCYRKLGDSSRARQIWKKASRDIPAFQKAREILKNDELRMRNDE